MKRKRTTAAYWREQFATQTASGLSVTAYLRQADIRSSQWYYWRKRLYEPTNVSNALVPVTLTAEAPCTHDCQIHLPNGIVLEFAGPFEPVQLTQQLLPLNS